MSGQPDKSSLPDEALPLTELQKVATSALDDALEQAKRQLDAHKEGIASAAEQERRAPGFADANRSENKLRREHAEAARGVSKIVRDMADSFMPGVMLTLCSIVANTKEFSSARIMAANAIADRSSMGRAKETFTPLAYRLSEMSTADAYNAIMDEATAGRMSLNEINMLTRTLEARTKSVEVEELAKQLADLKAVIAGESPATGPTQPRVN